MKRLRGRLLLTAVAGLATLTVLATGATAAPARQPDLKLAVRDSAGCGSFADALPALVTQPGVSPGTTVADVTVCVKNVGEAGRSLALTAAELVDLDSACTGDEAAVDTTCGGGGVGELSTSLVQLVGVDNCQRNPKMESASARSLANLSTSALVVADRLQKNASVCVRLALLYQPGSGAAVRSQSDRALWRYAFSLTGDG